MDDTDDTPRVTQAKALLRQIAGSLDSSRSHYAVADQLVRVLQRDFAGLSVAEYELVMRWIRRMTNT